MQQTARRRPDPAQTAPPTMSPDRSLGYQLNRVTRAMMEKVARITEKHGVNRAHWGYMHHLHADDGLSQRELSDRVCRQTSTTVSALKRMQDVGLVTVRKNALDQRRNTVHLTSTGRDLTEAILSELSGMGQNAFKGISVKDTDAFWRTLHQIRNNIED